MSAILLTTLISYLLTENGKQTNRKEVEELANENNLIELKKWLHSYVQQTWPITWEKGQYGLKEIIEREIDPSLFEEIQNGIKATLMSKSQASLDSIMQMTIKNHLTSLERSLFENDDKTNNAFIEAKDKPSNIMKLGVLIQEQRLESARTR